MRQQQHNRQETMTFDVRRRRSPALQMRRGNKQKETKTLLLRSGSEAAAAATSLHVCSSRTSETKRGKGDGAGCTDGPSLARPVRDPRRLDERGQKGTTS
ncbi:hypothetical protein MRX96_016628 [Rhipicephalus microplus]